MIYISSACVKFNKISESINFLAKHGFKNIELSGGTEFYDNIEKDLLELKNKYNLSYFIHNYFPPPENHFVLNLASLDDEIFNKTINHFTKAINLAKKIKAKKIGLHAGYFIDPSINELGKNFSTLKKINKSKAIKRFCLGYNRLKNLTDKIDIYIENNVISEKNFNVYNDNPFMLTNYNEYIDLKEKIDFPLILDIAHLKVSCNTLKLNFNKEFELFINKSDYLHISDNNGKQDQNKSLSGNSKIFNLLKKINLNKKIITLEIYDNINKIRESYNLLKTITL